LRDDRRTVVHVVPVCACGVGGASASIGLSRNGFDVPSAGAGAQCSTTPQWIACGFRLLDDVLELAEEIGRAAGLGFGGAPVVAREQQGVPPARVSAHTAATLLVDAALLEAAFVSEILSDNRFDR
jgi:hypothetical protein